MITKLSIKNFKGWKNTGPIKLEPITVFFGANSTGKSSIGQFLMMLKQTAASPDRNRVLHPGDSQSAVDLGTFEDLMYQHDMASTLEFSLAWKLPQPLVIEDVLEKASVQGNSIEFSAVIGYEDTCREFHYRLLKDDAEKISLAMTAQQKHGNYQLSAEGMKLVRRPGRVWPLPSPTRFFGFPDEMVNYYQNADSLSDLALAMQELLKKVAYLGPLREEPKRGYTWTGETPEDVGRRGELWVSAFLAASERVINPGYKKRGCRFDEYIARWLKMLGIIHSFEVTSVGQGQRDYRVRVQTRPGVPVVAIPDVGFGVSQVLPVIVESLYAPPNSTVIIEQPELHLHPAVQQNLADLFINAVQCREKGQPRNVQFVVESHSEHFLRRLQRRVAEGSLPKADLAAYFCDTGSDGSILVPLNMNSDGNITNWPKDFFGDQMTDIAEMQLAAIRRQQTETEK